MGKRGTQPRHKLEMSRNPQEIFREKKQKHNPLGGGTRNWLNPLFTEWLQIL